MIPASPRSHSASNPTSPVVTSPSIVTSSSSALNPAVATRPHAVKAAPPCCIALPALEMWNALRSRRSSAVMVCASASRSAFFAHLGQSERIVAGERRLFALRPDEVDAGDGDVRAACTVEALRQRIDDLGSDRAPEAHHPRPRHRIRVLDRPRRHRVGEIRPRTGSRASASASPCPRHGNRPEPPRSPSSPSRPARRFTLPEAPV